jgi:DNA-binding SARP family transcriptional activator/predicted ATPase
MWFHDHVQVGVLGPLTVRVGDRDGTPRGQRSRDVFVVLLLRRGRPVPAEVVLDLVWGREASGLDVSVVHTVVARLRRQLGPAAIVSRDGGYLFAPGASTDEDAFTELVGAARQYLDAGNARAASAHYRRAIDQWHGSEAFDGVRPDLVEADRARLTELRAAAAEELAAAYLDHPELGSATHALALTAQVIAAHPLRERAHQLAMLAAYRSHRQADALAMYDQLRRRLRSELGIEPAAATAQLYSMILRHEPELDAQHSTPAPAPSGLRATGPPAPVSPLIGRSAELIGLLGALADGRRLITLAGPGGVGKSRLLAEVGIRYAGPRHLVYTAMSGLTSGTPEELAEAVGMANGVTATRRGPLDALIHALIDGSWLLLIDEAEWVIDPLTTVLASILDHCPGVQILLTSRVPVELAGELLISIEPLECPDANAETPAILQTPAVEFLRQRLTDRAVTVDTDPTSAALLATIARRVDGLPLALELAAGQASGRSLADIAVLVESPLDVSASGQPSNIRHRSLRDTLEWSVSRLDDDHRTVLRRLSVYVGHFDLPGAVAVVGPVEDVGGIVRYLAREALIHVERSSASRLHFRLLRTVRDLALEGLGTEELAAAQALHRRWHAGRWRGGSVDLVVDVRERIDDYLEALRTALESRDATTLADLTLTLTQFWQFTGGQAVGLRWIARVLDSDVLSSGERARVQAQRAALALHHDPAIVLADTALAIPVLEAAGETQSAVTALVTALSVRAFELYAQGNSAAAGAHADRAVSMARTGDADLLARALATAGLIHAVSEQVELAGAAIDEARDCLDALPASADRTATGSTLTLALVNLERFTDALEVSDTVTPPEDPPPRYLLARGWAALGAGLDALALQSFAGSIPAGRPQPADRQSVETVLGAGCVLAAIGHPSAAWALSGGLELVRRVEYLTPPALDRAIDRARGQVANQDWPDCSTDRTTALLRRLEHNLTTVADQLSSADGRSAAG